MDVHGCANNYCFDVADRVLGRIPKAVCLMKFSSPKIGIVVVAYNAVDTLHDVLDRIPTDFRSRVSRVYVCDDHSDDATFHVGVEYRDTVSDLDVHVVRWNRNLGYGGNQKASYALAIADGMDIVVLLLGDGQYAPEVIETIVQPLVDGTADAVFGSRMMTAGQARKGGMPRYKYYGNKILTRFENAVLGSNLSEFHSGYRAYLTGAISTIGFGDLSDDFDFDTEIIVRLLDREMRIVEVPIPTYYGDEICRVNGMKYAGQVATDVVTWRLNRLGLGRGRLGTPPAEYAVKPDPLSSHAQLLTWLADKPAASVLDVGCSSGQFTQHIAQIGHHVTGVDAVEHPQIHEICDTFWLHDLDEGLPAEVRKGTFDVVVLGDVIEHLRDPLSLLNQSHEALAPDGEILVSVPNISHWYPRLRVGLGLFDYDTRGILDATHLRFFTRRSVTRLLGASGFDVTALSYSASPASEVIRRGKFGRYLHRVALQRFPSLFAYQILVRATPTVPIGATTADHRDSALS